LLVKLSTYRFSHELPGSMNNVPTTERLNHLRTRNLRPANPEVAGRRR